MRHDGLSEFPVVVTLPVQWGDQDSFGHVNNTVYLRWCETARIEYLIRVGLWMVAPDGTGPILAAISCDYRRPLRFPCNVRIGARVTKIGNSSFRMEHLVVGDVDNTVAAEAHSTLVVLNYKHGKPVPVPDAVREAIERLEDRTFERPAAV
ncbi:MAG: acyl-CoA thioesterase [Acidobacteriota bacterium]